MKANNYNSYLEAYLCNTKNEQKQVNLFLCLKVPSLGGPIRMFLQSIRQFVPMLIFMNEFFHISRITLLLQSVFVGFEVHKLRLFCFLELKNTNSNMADKRIYFLRFSSKILHLGLLNFFSMSRYDGLHIT